MRRAQLVDATSEGTVTFKFYVGHRYSNLNSKYKPEYSDDCVRSLAILDVVHGGAYGVLFGMIICGEVSQHAVLIRADMFTTTALAPIARPGFWDFMGGITRNLNISYLRGIPAGSTVMFKSRVVQYGKTAALIYGEALTEDGKKVYATAEHHKINVPMLEEHKAAKVKWDETMDAKARAGKL